jgi:heme A synthase
MNADLQLFVRDSLTRGLPRAAIRERLLEAGWRPEEVDSALAGFAEVDFPVPVPRRRPYLSAREAFLYLVLFATLYITAFNLGLVLFGIVDRWLPDPVQNPYSLRWATEALHNGIAALVIAFPIFLFLSALIGRALARDPEKRGSAVRKWLTYLTLFVAALVLIGDLTFVLQRLLAGELVARVLWKTLVVFEIGRASCRERVFDKV